MSTNEHDHDGGVNDGLRQRMQQKGAPADDLFLSLALNDSDTGSAPQRKPLGRSGIRERARSTESITPSSSAARSPSLTQGPDGPSRPRQEAVRTPRYTLGTTTLSHFEAAAREWNASPDLLKFPSRRQTSTSTSQLSDAVSRQSRAYRAGAYSRRLHQGHVTPTLSPNPSVRKRSDPETESVDSANAPSTVWDELDDLKSRIRNLEITGKMPSTSNAAVASHTQSFDRPRTATTAPTTISSSPQHARKQSLAPTEINSVGPATANIHPLLHNALVRAKTLLSPQLYRALEATADDALTLAAMTGSGGPQGTAFTAASIINGVAVSERHIRRKADSMCRNLTDLCIALCEGKSDLTSPTIKASPVSVSRLHGETPPSRYSRRTSLGPDDLQLRTSPGRALSRLETRRSSLLGLGMNSSPGEASEQYMTQDSSPQQNQTDYAARYSRPGTSFMRTRQSRYDEDLLDEPLSRAPSRAMTDVGHMRQQSTRRTDFSVGIQHSPSLRDGLSARRSTVGIPEEGSQDEAIQSPMPAQNGARRFLERHSATNEERFIPEKRRRIASLSQYSSSSPRVGGEPMRTSSLSRRRNVVVE